MKVKNIMFSGFAAAILMGVGAADAVVANPVTLADQGYVDAKINLVAGQKEAVANKVSEITEENRDNEDLYTSVKAVTGYVKEITTGEMGQLGDLAVLNSIKNANVADDAAIAQSKIDGLVDALAEKAVKSEVETALGNKADKSVVDGLLTGNDSVANQIANALKNEDGSAKYETAGAAAQALTDANAYTDQQVGALDTKVTNAEYVNAAGAVAAVEAAGYATTEDVSTAAAEAAATAVANSGHAKQADLLAEVERATAAEVANKALIDANAADIKELQDAGYTTMTAVEGKGYAVATEVANTYATKAEITQGNYASKTEAQGYATAAAEEAVNALGIDDYAKTADVNDELAKKLDKTAIDNAAGTYMVTSNGAGGFTYTKVRVATGVDGSGNATVTE